MKHRDVSAADDKRPVVAMKWLNLDFCISPSHLAIMWLGKLLETFDVANSCLGSNIRLKRHSV